MNHLIRTTAQSLRGRFAIPAYRFSKDIWEKRDRAEETVYINKSEKQLMQRLLKKVEEQQADGESNYEEFSRKIKEIMKRYKIENDALQFELIGLHRQFRE